MAETITSLAIIAMLSLIAAFVGYVIISGDHEEAKKKKSKRANVLT